MRRHDARKWLHAILDLLPVILIPVFMIYSHRHTIDSYTIDVPQNKVADFNQQIDFYNNWNTRYSNYERHEDYILLTNTSQTSAGDFYLQYGFGNDYRFNVGDIWLIDFKIKLPTDYVGNCFYFFTGGSGGYYYLDSTNLPKNEYYHLQALKEITVNGNLNYYRFMSDYHGGDVYIQYPMIFNLTQMFGAGNEPTIEKFNEWFDDDYYQYTLHKNVLVKDFNTVTYNDTDIMSQFTYNLYNSVDKYFNMNNVFGLNGVYDWFNLNIFNGNAPLYIYIIWNIVLYEFVMDLLMLLYALFMWFIDFCQDLIDRCFTTSKGGKH